MPLMDAPAFLHTRDGIVLEAAVYVKRPDPSLVGAVVCHPYAPLGGSANDPVVRKVAAYFQSKGVSTVRFNFRGGGASGGAASWTAAAERADVHAAADYLRDTGGARAVVLVGYSYGSIVASATAGERNDVLGVAALSYPYGYLWALTLFRGSAALGSFARAKAPKLLLAGDSDDFTSLSKYSDLEARLRVDSELAAEELEARRGAGGACAPEDRVAAERTRSVTMQIVEDTDHFWRDGFRTDIFDGWFRDEVLGFCGGDPRLATEENLRQVLGAGDGS